MGERTILGRYIDLYTYYEQVSILSDITGMRKSENRIVVNINAKISTQNIFSLRVQYFIDFNKLKSTFKKKDLHQTRQVQILNNNYNQSYDNDFTNGFNSGLHSNTILP